MQPMSVMEHVRTIPRSGETIPAIGLGTWQTFDPPNLNPRTLEPLAEVLRTFHAAGGRLLDTSPMYGKAERAVGLVSDGLELFLATKVWTNGKTAGVRQLESSLRETKRERLDLVEVHNLLDWRTQLATLREWQEAGRIRYVGVTHYHPTAFAEVEKVMKHEPLDFVQLPYSAGARAAEERLLPLARDKGIAVIANRPFEEGALLRRALSRALPLEARRFAATWPEALLKFVISHPAITAVIPATRNPAHLAEILEAGAGPLPDESERHRLVVALS